MRGSHKADAAARPVRLWAVLVWLAVWQGGSMALRLPLLLPSPLDALLRLGQLIQTADFWRIVLRSSLRILSGFTAGAAGGILSAVGAFRCRRLRELLDPLAAAVRAVPVASFVILSLVWLDARSLAVFIAALMALPPVYLGVLEGLNRTDPALLEMARVFRVPRIRRIWNLYLPGVLPFFRTASSLAMGLCWKAGVAAEVIGLPSASLGDRLYQAKVYFLTADLFAWTAVIIALSMCFERLVLWLLDALAARTGGK